MMVLYCFPIWSSSADSPLRTVVYCRTYPLNNSASDCVTAFFAFFFAEFDGFAGQLCHSGWK